MNREWKEITKREHDGFIKASSLCNLLQSSAWASVKDGWDHECIGFFEDGVMHASALLLIQRLPLHLSMIYIPHGPIMDYQNEELVRHAMKELKVYAKRRHCFSITMDPAIIRRIYDKTEIVENFDEHTNHMISLFSECGISHLGYTMDMDETIQPRFHAGVKTYQGFEDEFPKHTKRHIKKAVKNGIVIQHGRYELLNDFARLMQKNRGT